MEIYSKLLGADGLEQSLGGITTNIIVRNETKNHYTAFAAGNYSALQAAIDSHDVLHEVVYGGRPQRIKIDWDGGAIAADPVAVRDEIMAAIVDEFAASYMIEACALITNADIMVMNSNSATKISYHFLIAPRLFVVANASEAREFVTRVASRCSAIVANQFDLGVYKSLQNFRILGCSKGDRRKKLENSTGDTLGELADSLVSEVSAPHLQLLPELCAPAPPRDPTLTVSSAEMDRALDLAVAAGFTIGFVVRSFTNNFIVFRRMAPSYCAICRDTHHNDNTLMVIVVDTVDDTGSLCRNAFAKCRHAPRGSNVFLGAITENITNIDKFEWRGHHYTPDHDSVAGIPNAMTYNEPIMRPLNLRARTLFVRAAMGLGKSKALKAAIRTTFSDPDERIVLVTFRQTFAAETLSKLRDDGFELYSDQVGGILNQKRLIVQVESLHRLSYENVGLLILDECESIFSQLNSGLGINNASSFANFIWSLQYATHVVCLDALLGDRTYNIVRQVRDLRDLQLHWNTYTPAAADTYHVTININAFMDEMCDALRAGNNIFIPTNSLVAANTIYEHLLGEFPQLSIGLYTKNTPQAIKKSHYADVNTYWAAYRVVIITPTVSAGVSFERAHFDRVFGYFVDCSCVVETCMQMIGRVRNVSQKSYTLYIHGTPLQVPITHAEITDTIINRRNNLSMVGGLAPDVGTLEVTQNGRIQVRQSNYWHVWVENRIAINLSRQNFVARLLWRLQCSGAVIKSLGRGGKSKDFSLYNKIVKDKQAQSLADSVDLPTNQAEQLMKDIKDQLDTVSTADKLAVEKFKLRSYYDFKGPINATFVRVYNTIPLKRQYRNLQCIHWLSTADPLDAASATTMLESIRHSEQLRYDTLPDIVQTRINTATTRIVDGRIVGSRLPDCASYNDILDLNYYYNYDKHRVAFMLISKCGFRTLYDTTSIIEHEIERNIQSNTAYFKSLKTEVCRLFEVMWISNAVVNPTYSAILSCINTVLKHMYGVRIDSQVATVLRYYTISHGSWPWAIQPLK